ncbi:RagB/SusD family nutrient uptake outer membrane protein [Algivirga pacifica]|uniref:RagB/SusD family nutrient uptake outer membrane protein n=1 Tax=Algivirga pacifica TaxID=1162670 RepID=A0ABP9D591_9BACT
MKSYIKNMSRAAMLIAAMATTSCVGDLDVTPIDPDVNTADKALNSPEAMAQALSKIYAGFAVTGNIGPAGSGDVAGVDEGESSYWRLWFVAQEFPTDEAINGWGDKDLPTLSQVSWTADNSFSRAFYYRSLYQVTLANEFIRQAAVYGAEYADTDRQVGEARFLRALAYYHALDMFGNKVPNIEQDKGVGAWLPQPWGQSERGPELFDFIESELMAAIEALPTAAEAFVGQANKDAAKMTLAKLYLNHAVYRGQEDVAYYQKGKTMVDEVIANGSFDLMDADDVAGTDAYSPYEFNFLADNHTSNEIIFAISQDGNYSRTYGGTTFIINAATGANKDAMGGGAWYGTRTTKALVNLFDADDARALWFTEGHNLEITDQSLFTEGYAVEKFKNMKRDGSKGDNASAEFADTDVPVYRLADAYLMAAELDIRINGSVSATSLDMVNELRARAGVTAVTSMDLDFILDERARELYWEAHRRTDLIRFGKFTGGEYVWPLKGNSLPDGGSVSAHYELMPIPPSDLNANPNLSQNAGY